jgi:alkanesulfonate monooxygenase SsuD/methylene tetrahydromethanopterin reductase-like flavin-dependent oxidoreductase (luciferase family)
VWRWSPEAHGQRAARLREICERANRDPSSVRLSVGLYTLIGEEERDLAARYRALQAWTPGGALDGESLEDYGREALVGTPQRCLERLAAFASNGVEEMVVSAASLPFAVQDWSMVELIAESLIPQAAAL